MQSPNTQTIGSPKHVRVSDPITATGWNQIVDRLPTVREDAANFLNQRIWWSKLSFHPIYLSPSSIRISKGNLRIHGSKNIAVAQTDVTLTGDPEWIYIEHDRTSATAAIQHATTEPVTTPTLLRVPLYKFEATGGTWALTEDRRFDINFDTPLR